MTDATRAAIERELAENEFRAGEFYTVLSRRYGIGEWTIRQVAVKAKRAANREPFTGRAVERYRAGEG